MHTLLSISFPNESILSLFLNNLSRSSPAYPVPAFVSLDLAGNVVYEMLSTRNELVDLIISLRKIDRVYNTACFVLAKQ